MVAFHGGLVDRRYKELLRLKLSTLHGCRFCNQGNRADASAAGFSDEEIDAITDMSSDVFQGADKAVLFLAMRLSMIDTVVASTMPALRCYLSILMTLKLSSWAW